MAREEALRSDLDYGGKRGTNLGAPAAARDATYTDNTSAPRSSGLAAAGTSLLAAPADHVHPAIDQLLETDPVDVGTTYSLSYTSGLVTSEVWKRANTTVYKQIDYTYTAGLVTTEVRKVFAANGTTVIGQITFTYSYSGGLWSSTTQTRDI